MLYYRLFQHIDTFLKACSEGVFYDSVGGLLLEIFKGGPSITLAIKESHVVTMMALLREEPVIIHDPHQQQPSPSTSHTSSPCPSLSPSLSPEQNSRPCPNSKAAIINALMELLIVCSIL